MSQQNSKGSKRAQGMLSRAAHNLGAHARVVLGQKYESPKRGRPVRKAHRREKDYRIP